MRQAEEKLATVTWYTCFLDWISERTERSGQAEKLSKVQSKPSNREIKDARLKFIVLVATWNPVKSVFELKHVLQGSIVNHQLPQGILTFGALRQIWKINLFGRFELSTKKEAFDNKWLATRQVYIVQLNDHTVFTLRHKLTNFNSSVPIYYMCY